MCLCYCGSIYVTYHRQMIWCTVTDCLSSFSRRRFPWYYPTPTGFTRLLDKFLILLGIINPLYYPGPSYRSGGYRLEELVCMATFGKSLQPLIKLRVPYAWRMVCPSLWLLHCAETQSKIIFHLRRACWSFQKRRSNVWFVNQSSLGYIDRISLHFIAAL